ncbi:hypothetical protein H2203_002617 [Taxawa tesnikishii (nom. ined.)]|nr:hypothetical protein H2203_002617 [Dothideales sp. JES 119]
MKRFTAGLLNRTKSQDDSAPGLDSPEASAARGVGEEVLHLPVIVEAAESSPQAAASAAYQIRKFLSKENNNRSHVQYNAIMLIRILTDNPGPTFTRNLDPKFVDTVRNLLKNGRDPSVQQILRETLDALEANKSYDEGLQPLLSMWRATKGSKASISPNPRAPQNFRVPAFNPNAPPMPPSQRASNQQYFTRSQLPPPGELASRIEEARNTAKILLQLIQSTPPEEISNNELVKEFAERCQGAQRSMQEYINCDNPPPDDDTLQTLIEINEQLSLAASRHQRAMLSGRRVVGAQSGAQNGTQSPNLIDVGGNSNNGYGSVPQPPPRNEYPQYPTQQQPYNAFDSAPQQTYNAFTQSQRQPDLSNANPYSHEQPTPQQQTYNAFTNTTHSLSPYLLSPLMKRTSPLHQDLHPP